MTPQRDMLAVLNRTNDLGISSEAKRVSENQREPRF
jgi:hypothetical protein